MCVDQKKEEFLEMLTFLQHRLFKKPGLATCREFENVSVLKAQWLIKTGFVTPLFA
jgi:hypothetical protein